MRDRLQFEHIKYQELKEERTFISEENIESKPSDFFFGKEEKKILENESAKESRGRDGGDLGLGLGLGGRREEGGQKRQKDEDDIAGNFFALTVQDDSDHFV